MTRRRALRILIGAGAAMLSLSKAGPIRAAAPRGGSPRGAPADPSQFDQYLRFLAPNPAKQRLALADSASLANQLSATHAGTLQPPAGYTDARILQAGRWTSGSHPNYSDTALRSGERFVWAACYDSRTVTQLNVTRSTTTSFGPYAGAHPLDVRFDVLRNRLAVACADSNDPSEYGKAWMLVLDLGKHSEIIAMQDLAALAGQGPCRGGAQGVAIDARGDYWFTLAYSGQMGRGAVVKVDGDTLDPVVVLKDVAPSEPIEGLSNPNGIVTDDAGQHIFTFSDTGRSHQFDLDGNLLHTFTTVSTGYRGAVRGHDMWVAAWVSPGEMAHIDLRSGARTAHPCAPLANSVAVDDAARVWVAGDRPRIFDDGAWVAEDAFISVSDSTGLLLAYATYGAHLNGLSLADGYAYTTSYGYDQDGEDSLLSFVFAHASVRLPALLLSGDVSP